MQPLIWNCRNHELCLTIRPRVMGIVNVTPDSFSDGGQFFDPSRAVEHGLKLASEGADILDIGGESTRPGAESVPLEVELGRVVPVVRELIRQTPVLISVDTSKAAVARACLELGAHIINDVSAMSFDAAMPDIVREYRAGVVLMHMRGNPQTMQNDPQYGDVVTEVQAYLEERIRVATEAGIEAKRIAVDPGIGFGKTLEHTLLQLGSLQRLTSLGQPVLLGISRKGFLGQITGRNRAERLAGTLAVNCFALACGAAHILRVHDVAAHVDAVKLHTAIAQAMAP
jgi:dihydropteroate synthase